jgi:hypothetical protein
VSDVGALRLHDDHLEREEPRDHRASPANATSLAYSFQTVDIRGASATNVQGVNNSGVAAGSFFAGGISQGFVRAADGTTTTFTIDGLSTGVGGINNRGQIAGNAGTSLGFTSATPMAAS